MSNIKQYAAMIIMVIILVVLTILQHRSPNNYPLYRYIIAVAVVWVIILSIVHFVGSPEHFNQLVLVGAGYWIWMLAMYIAMHVYTS